ncbi:hypothetical protein ES708_16726 [subsurface metagenome]
MLKKKYLIEQTMTGGKSYEIKGYKITQKAIDCLRGIELLENPEEEQGEEQLEEPSIEIKYENVLPTPTFPKNQNFENINDPEWMDEFDLELSEIIVPCKMKFEKGNYEEAYNFLKVGWERAMEKVENYPQTSGLIEKLRERYQWIKDTNFNNEDEMHSLINRIEYFVISM